MDSTLPESWSVALSAIYCCADHAVLRILFKASRKSVRMRESKPSPERSSSCSPRSSVMAFSRRGETLTAPADPEFTAPASGITQQIIPTAGSNADSQKGHTLGNVKSTPTHSSRGAAAAYWRQEGLARTHHHLSSAFLPSS